MSRMIIVGSFLGMSIALSLTACEITTCEGDAHCPGSIGGDKYDDDRQDDESQHEQCLLYCERLSVCGAPQARDFEVCIEACEERFEELPDSTAELCACIPRSRCEDVIDGRCTDPGSGGQGGSGGSSATGGSPGNGGSYATGGSPEQGGSSAGGSPAQGGSSAGGAHTGGSHSTGGSSSGATGGTASGGSDTGGAGGDDPGPPCTCSCQCLSGQSCVEGHCSG